MKKLIVSLESLAALEGRSEALRGQIIRRAAELNGSEVRAGGEHQRINTLFKEATTMISAGELGSCLFLEPHEKSIGFSVSGLLEGEKILLLNIREEI